MTLMLVRRCAWCGDVSVDGRWEPPAVAPRPDEATHGICDSCFTREEAAAAGAAQRLVPAAS